MSATDTGIKPFTEMGITDRMRHYLQPKGASPIVQLKTLDSCGMWLRAEFVTKCIDELDRMHVRVACGEGPTNLEKLAYMLLCDSAYIENKDVNKV